MELLNQIFAIMFYILFFSWAFLKIRNFVLIKKMHYKEIYKNIKKDLKHQKLSKYLIRIIITNIIILSIYLVTGLVIGIFALFMMFLTLGGAAYVTSGTDSTFYDNLIDFVGNYLSLFKYIIYYIHLIVYMILIRAIYINILSYKKLKSDALLNNFKQN